MERLLSDNWCVVDEWKEGEEEDSLEEGEIVDSDDAASSFDMSSGIRTSDKKQNGYTNLDGNSAFAVIENEFLSDSAPLVSDNDKLGESQTAKTGLPAGDLLQADRMKELGTGSAQSAKSTDASCGLNTINKKLDESSDIEDVFAALFEEKSLENVASGLLEEQTALSLDNDQNRLWTDSTQCNSAQAVDNPASISLMAEASIGLEDEGNGNSGDGIVDMLFGLVDREIDSSCNTSKLNDRERLLQESASVDDRLLVDSNDTDAEVDKDTESCSALSTPTSVLSAFDTDEAHVNCEQSDIEKTQADIEHATILDIERKKSKVTAILKEMPGEQFKQILDAAKSDYNETASARSSTVVHVGSPTANNMASKKNTDRNLFEKLRGMFSKTAVSKHEETSTNEKSTTHPEREVSNKEKSAMKQNESQYESVAGIENKKDSGYLSERRQKDKQNMDDKESLGFNQDSEKSLESGEKVMIIHSTRAKSILQFEKEPQDEQDQQTSSHGSVAEQASLLDCQRSPGDEQMSTEEENIVEDGLPELDSRKDMSKDEPDKVHSHKGQNSARNREGIANRPSEVRPCDTTNLSLKICSVVSLNSVSKNSESGADVNDDPVTKADTAAAETAEDGVLSKTGSAEAAGRSADQVADDKMETTATSPDDKYQQLLEEITNCTKRVAYLPKRSSRSDIGAMSKKLMENGSSASSASVVTDDPDGSSSRVHAHSDANMQSPALTHPSGKWWF